MAEWLKILISALVGVVTGVTTGILGEPMKSAIQRYFTAKRARKAIYNELGMIYALFCLSDSKTHPSYCEYALKHSPPDDFDYYYTQHRESCFLIPDWPGIQGFYLMYKALRDLAEQKTTSPDRFGSFTAMVNGIEREFNIKCDNGLLDKEEVMAMVKIQPRTGTSAAAGNPDSANPHP
jgi:hypothetical protein